MNWRCFLWGHDWVRTAWFAVACGAPNFYCRRCKVDKLWGPIT
jgi:hypothetical protein